MRPWRSRTPEGYRYTYLRLESFKNIELAVSEMGSFPILLGRRSAMAPDSVCNSASCARLLLAVESSKEMSR